MSKKNKAKRQARASSKLLDEFFRKRVLLPGENPKLYDELYRRVTASACPKDIIEEMLVKDVIDITWEINRFRRMIELSLQNDRTAATANLMETIFEPELLEEESQRLARKRAIELAVGSDETRGELTSRMKRFGLSDDSITAEAFSRRIEVVEKVDRMIASAENRRNKIIREIEFRRSYLAGQLEIALKAEVAASRQIAQASRSAECDTAPELLVEGTDSA